MFIRLTSLQKMLYSGNADCSDNYFCFRRFATMLALRFCSIFLPYTLEFPFRHPFIVNDALMRNTRAADTLFFNNYFTRLIYCILQRRDSCFLRVATFPIDQPTSTPVSQLITIIFCVWKPTRYPVSNQSCINIVHSDNARYCDRKKRMVSFFIWIEVCSRIVIPKI